MIFSDLGTLNAETTRGFSAYRWIKTRLVELGVPAGQIAFMQDFKKSSAKQRLFNDVNGGAVRILIGSSETMGTGVNAQRRLIALHHLDVPWLPSQITQREGRIERQGNENGEIELYAYATRGSVDATGWQMLERKARFIDMAMSGDRSIRRLEDAGNQVNQFAMAKAIASGDPRLMQKAGLEAEIARLERLRASHFDDHHAVRRKLSAAEAALAHAERRIADITLDLAQRTPIAADAFIMQVETKTYSERKQAGTALLNAIRHHLFQGVAGAWPLAMIGGFEIELTLAAAHRDIREDLTLRRNGVATQIEFDHELTALGLISRLEYTLSRFEVELMQYQRAAADNAGWIPAYRQRLGENFAFKDELAEKRAEIEALEASLAATAADADEDDLPDLGLIVD
jgi:hypothetical protein